MSENLTFANIDNNNKDSPNNISSSNTSNSIYSKRPDIPASRSIWVGSLPNYITYYMVSKLANYYGPLESIQLNNTIHYKHKPFSSNSASAFLNYINKEDAIELVDRASSGTISLMGKIIKIAFAKSRNTDLEIEKLQGQYNNDEKEGNNKITINRHLIITNLTNSINELQLYRLFSQYGEIESIKLIKDEGIAYITTAGIKVAAQCISSLNGYEIDKQKITVHFGDDVPRKAEPWPEEFISSEKMYHDGIYIPEERLDFITSKTDNEHKSDHHSKSDRHHHSDHSHHEHGHKDRSSHHSHKRERESRHPHYHRERDYSNDRERDYSNDRERDYSNDREKVSNSYDSRRPYPAPVIMPSHPYPQSQYYYPSTYPLSYPPYSLPPNFVPSNPNLANINHSLPPNINHSLPHNINPSLPPNINPSLPHNINPSLPHNINPSLPHNINPSLPNNINPSVSPNIAPQYSSQNIQSKPTYPTSNQIASHNPSQAYYRSVRINNIPFNINISELCSMLNNNGGPIESVAHDRNHHSCFVSFAQPIFAQKFISQVNSHRINIPIDVHIQPDRERPETVAPGVTRAIMIRNLPPDIDKHLIESMCATFGQLETITMIPEENAALVNYLSIKSALHAVSKLNSTYLSGNIVRLECCDERLASQLK